MIKHLFHNVIFLLYALIVLTAACTILIMEGQWIWSLPIFILLLYCIRNMSLSDKRFAKRVAIMFDAIDNNDFTFHYPTEHRTTNDQMVNDALNHITKMLFQAKTDTIEREKYYELILNSINTGIIVIDDNGYVYQSNNEAMRLLGMSVFTHLQQLERVDSSLKTLIENIQPGSKQQISFTNELGSVHLSIRSSEMMLHNKHVRILAVNDIKSELDENEIDSWMRITRVLTHEIMNSVTPITSISDTLLSQHNHVDDEMHKGLETISATGKSLIAFVESYRKFTHIPTPEPSLFYVKQFAERMVNLSRHHYEAPNIQFNIDVQPADLIVYADENLISQVMLNLLKNAIQAIGPDQQNGCIVIRAFSNKEEAVIIEVSDNGPAIPPEEAEHIFIPFFTTKEGGSGIGLSVSRQIMRLSGGSITLKSSASSNRTTFTLTFP